MLFLSKISTKNHKEKTEFSQSKTKNSIIKVTINKLEKIIHRMGKGCKWVHRKGNQNRKKSFIRILFSPVIGVLHLTTEVTISCQSALKILGC